VAATFATESRIVVSKDQVACDLGGEATILNLRNSTYYGLDPVGARVWQLIQEPTTLAQIRDVLKAEYDVDAAQLEADIRDLLEQLAEQGLVEIAQ
jgi:Coenzyme PQQ synthesis protein D (PqqD)